MGRIIKGPKDSEASKSKSPTIEPYKYAEGGRVIEKDVYKAQLLARDILKEGELSRRKKLADARRIVAQAREEALSSGAVEAFNETAKNAILIFSERISYLSSVLEDVRVLAVEIAEKVLGGHMRLDQNEQNQLIANGINKMRMKRKLAIQCSSGSLTALQTKAPSLMKRIEQEPDIDLEETSDIKPGHFRIVTDVGAALCDESAVLSALHQSFHE